MNNKILVEIYVPLIEEEYDVFIPINKRIGTIKQIFEKLIAENSDSGYKVKEDSNFYSKETGMPYEVQLVVKDTDLKNGSRIVLI